MHLLGTGNSGCTQAPVSITLPPTPDPTPPHPGRYMSITLRGLGPYGTSFIRYTRSLLALLNSSRLGSRLWSREAARPAAGSEAGAQGQQGACVAAGCMCVGRSTRQAAS